MTSGKKYFETGSNPYYLNLGNTAKDFSFNETTNPQNGLLNTLTQHIIIEENIYIQQPLLKDQIILEDLP
jgi:hypothetical protein